MLYVGNGDSSQTRIQGAFLSDQEVQDVVNYVVEQQQANYVKKWNQMHQWINRK